SGQMVVAERLVIGQGDIEQFPFGLHIAVLALALSRSVSDTVGQSRLYLEPIGIGFVIAYAYLGLELLENAVFSGDIAQKPISMGFIIVIVQQLQGIDFSPTRSEERRVGKECRS